MDSHTHIERDFGGGSEGRSPSVRRLRRWPEGRERRRERTRAGVKGETPLHVPSVAWYNATIPKSLTHL